MTGTAEDASLRYGRSLRSEVIWGKPSVSGRTCDYILMGSIRDAMHQIRSIQQGYNVWTVSMQVIARQIRRTNCFVEPIVPSLHAKLHGRARSRVTFCIHFLCVLSLSSVLSLVIYCESISCQVFCSASQVTWLKENVNHNGNGCKGLFDFWQWLNLGMVVYVEFLGSKVEICTILFDERVRSTLGKERKRRASMN